MTDDRPLSSAELEAIIAAVSAGTTPPLLTSTQLVSLARELRDLRMMLAALGAVAETQVKINAVVAAYLKTRPAAPTP